MRKSLPTLRRETGAYNVMIKPVGGVCNLDCTYCYYLRTQFLYPDIPEHVMSEETAQEFITHYVQQPVPVITLAWQGGEPTLRGIPFFEKAARFARQATPPGKQIEHAFQTNGTLLDDDWCRFFRREKFLIGISVDGPANIHDQYRLTRGRQPTHNRVMKGLELLKKHGVSYNFLCTLHRNNAEHPEEVYDFFVKELGVSFVQFIPILEREADGSVSPYSLQPGQYGRFLNRVFDVWAKRDVGKVSVQMFEQHLSARMGFGASLCIHTKRCGRALILEFNGDLYSCDHFVMPEHNLGNIHDTPMPDLVAGAQQSRFADMKEMLPPKCESCDYLTSCYGGCPKHRNVIVPEDGKQLNYFCEDYLAFYRHTTPYFDDMGQGIHRSIAREQKALRQRPARR